MAPLFNIELFESDSQWLFLTLWNHHLRLRYQHHLAKYMKCPLEECYYQWPPYNHLQILSLYYRWLWALTKHHNNVGWFHQETFLLDDYIRWHLEILFYAKKWKNIWIFDTVFKLGFEYLVTIVINNKSFYLPLTTFSTHYRTT